MVCHWGSVTKQLNVCTRQCPKSSHSTGVSLTSYEKRCECCHSGQSVVAYGLAGLMTHVFFHVGNVSNGGTTPS